MSKRKELSTATGISETYIYYASFLKGLDPVLAHKVTLGNLKLAEAFRQLEAQGVAVPFLFRTDRVTLEVKMTRQLKSAARRLLKECDCSLEAVRGMVDKESQSLTVA
jgi:hypothetical protein